MRYKLFDGVLDGSPNGVVNSILDFLKEDGHLIVALNSIGGEIGAGIILLDALHGRDEITSSVTLVGVNCLGSSAFRVFYNYRGPKFLTMNCIGMFHQSTIEIQMASNKRPDDNEGLIHMSNQSFLFEKGKQFAIKFMTPSEYKRFIRNKDIWFNIHRMAEIFPENKVGRLNY